MYLRLFKATGNPIKRERIYAYEYQLYRIIKVIITVAFLKELSLRTTLRTWRARLLVNFLGHSLNSHMLSIIKINLITMHIEFGQFE